MAGNRNAIKVPLMVASKRENEKKLTPMSWLTGKATQFRTGPEGGRNSSAYLGMVRSWG